MILALDVGNTQIFAGVFDQDQLALNFRMALPSGASSDQYGLFLKSALRENGLDPDKVQGISIGSVVPEQIHSLVNCCKKYFNQTPFILKAGVKTGLKIKYKNPSEVGADRIADAIAATHLYPGKNLIVIDFGTATTVEVISKSGEYLGGSILPGVRLAMEALEEKTSKLPRVEIVRPISSVGKTTAESIQSGLYYGNLGAIGYLKDLVLINEFKDEDVITIGTGGFASLYDDVGLFDVEIPNLVLQGLFLAMKMNM